ncbi:tetratricopeptide repeat-containing sensor histidine kinase [Cesiribacter andamanensis]|uniref:histidine kinase n=1 Tax=Cesiribacter andamanensis AMV16 TaxID=1279009 RepID=M7N0L5_9BACT|nr:tetratricopeptide repeat-containing sensor histidine kinase [Cesiribacter andamanensis]EMR00842.1 Non-motile and phage-resistance protein [Cesiribacter andamanensis AMV16]
MGKAFGVRFFVFLLTSVYALTASGQDQALADSLSGVLFQQEKQLTDSARYALYFQLDEATVDPNQRIEYSQKAIAFAKESKLRVPYAKAYIYLGKGYMQKGETARATDYYFQAAGLFREAGDKTALGATYDIIAQAYRMQKHYATAISYNKKSYSIFLQEKDSIRLASSLLNLGYLYYKASELDSALLYSQQSARLFGLLNYELAIAYASGNLGLIYATMAQDQQAEAQLQAAIALLKKYKDEFAIAEYQLELAAIYQQRGELQKALTHAYAGYQLAQKGGFKEFIRDASLKLSDLYAQRKHYAEAYEFHKQYITYRDSITNEESIRQMADLRTEYEVAQKQAEIEQLQKQKQSQQLLVISLVAILFLTAGLLLLIYFYTNHKLASNKQLSQQNEELVTQRNQLEALISTRNRLFSIISHDLRGPVNAFNGISELIRHYITTKDYDQLKEVSDYISKSASQLSSLLDNLLSWSVLQQGEFPYKPERVALQPICTEIGEMFQTMAHAKNIHLEISVEEPLMLWADANSVQTILRNLLSNALKFTKEWGTVSLTAVAKGGCAEIIVQDTGVGMSQEKLDSLFQPRNEKRTWGTSGEKGLGIGLRLVHDFASMNKGEVLALSQEGQGTTFIVSLPLHEAAQKAAPARQVELAR